MKSGRLLAHELHVKAENVSRGPRNGRVRKTRSILIMEKLSLSLPSGCWRLSTAMNGGFVPSPVLGEAMLGEFRKEYIIWVPALEKLKSEVGEAKQVHWKLVKRVQGKRGYLKAWSGEEKRLSKGRRSGLKQTLTDVCRSPKMD